MSRRSFPVAFSMAMNRIESPAFSGIRPFHCGMISRPRPVERCQSSNRSIAPQRMNALACSVRVSFPVIVGLKSIDAMTTPFLGIVALKSNERRSGAASTAIRCFGRNRYAFATSSLLILSPRSGNSAPRVTCRVTAPQSPPGIMNVCAITVRARNKAIANETGLVIPFCASAYCDDPCEPTLQIHGVTSLPWWRLPELDLVALRIHDPSEFPVFRVVGLVEHVATFLAQCFEKCVQIVDAIVDHEGRLARSEVFAVRRADRPGRSSPGRFAFGVSPVERRSTPGLNVDPEVVLVPIA